MSTVNSSTSTTNDLIIYQDTLAKGWDNWSWHLTAVNDTNNKQTGTASLAVSYTEAWAGLSVHASTPIDLTNYNAIHFWIYGNQGSGELSLFTQTTNEGNSSKSFEFTPTPNTWTEINVPLRVLGNPTTMARLIIMDWTGNSQPSYNIDDLYLVASVARLTIYGDANGAPVNDSLTGGDSAEQLYGLMGNDTLHGGNGNDTLYGFYGDDKLYGEADDDYLDGEQDNDYLEGGAGNDTVKGGNNNDTLSGNDGEDNLDGGDESDSLDGGNGNDTLDGGKGVDSMSGGAGNDTYYLGYDATDIIQDNGLSTDVDTIIMPYQIKSYTLPTGIENGTITGDGNGSLIGNASNNELTGNAGNNTLNGGAGTDTLSGGSGGDTYYVDNMNDTVIEAANNGRARGNGITEIHGSGEIDTIILSINAAYTLPEHVEQLSLQGKAHIGIGNSDNNVIRGNKTGNNSLNGGLGNDVLLGGAGNDSLIGGVGGDTLSGGAGEDTFVLDIASSDRISDFSSGKDKIQLDNNIFQKLTDGSLSAGAFILGRAAQDSSDNIIYNQITGALSYDDDGSGNHAAVQIALLGAKLALTAADFLVV